MPKLLKIFELMIPLDLRNFYKIWPWIYRLYKVGMKLKHLVIINHKEEVYFKDILCWNYNFVI